MTLPETSWPIVAATVVGGIGALGIIAGIVACRRVFAEIKTLEKGEDALTGEISSSDLDSTDPVTWLASNDLPKDSHFGDHLLSVWCGWVAERVPTLAELHNLSARRERRRLSARISGGITALLLICGIAGTLLCIHPLLEAFTIPINDNNEVVIEPLVAQKLIRSLGSAFLPSIVALSCTVLVAILRGMYLQTTTGLAWKLDRFAVAQLFPKFKPKRFGSELTEVHLKLAHLIHQLEERNEKFSEGVEMFGQAALNIKESGPKLKAASDRISSAADKLAKETESMAKSMDTHLGENSALIRGTNSIKEILVTCEDTARQLRDGGTALAKALAEASVTFETARTQLTTSVAAIPMQIEQGCESGSKRLIEASGNLEQAHIRLTDAVADIPLQIEKGCDLGSNILITANQQAAQGAVASIAKAAEAAANGINSSASSAQTDIQSSYAKAGEVFTSAASAASNQAATAIGKAASEAAEHVKSEVGPIAQVATEMRKQLESANKSYANAGEIFTNASNQAALAIGQAAGEAAKRLKAEVDPVTQVSNEILKQLESASKNYANAVGSSNRETTLPSNQSSTAYRPVHVEPSTSSKVEAAPIAQVAIESRQLDATVKDDFKATSIAADDMNLSVEKTNHEIAGTYKEPHPVPPLIDRPERRNSDGGMLSSIKKGWNKLIHR